MKKKIIIITLILFTISIINYGINTKILKETPKERKTVSRIILMQEGESYYDDDDDDDDDDDNEEGNSEEQENNTNENTNDAGNNVVSNPYDEAVDDNSVETKTKSNNSGEITAADAEKTTDNDEISENPKTGSTTYIITFILLISIISILYAGKGLKTNNE